MAAVGRCGGWRLACAVAVAALCVATAACKGNIGPLSTGPTIPPNFCTDANAALTNAACQLTLGQWHQDYLANQHEQFWYSVNVGTVTTRSIVHIIAGYFPPPDADGGIPDCKTVNFNTAVNLTMVALDQGAQKSLATASDQHGTACPTPMDVTFRYTQSNTSVIIVLNDDNGLKIDNKNKFSVMVEVLTDPDVNEPNDTPATATPIVLSPTSGGQAGKSSGYLSTPDDFDYFSVQAPGANYVLWFEVAQDPSVPAPPPHQYRLQYYVFKPDGTSELAEGDAPAGSQYSANLVALGNALLLQQAGTYYIKVMGYRDTQTVGQVPGDLNFKYLLNVIIVPLSDPTEGTTPPYNNDYAAAYPVNGGSPIAVGGSQTVTGRASYVGDVDWYAVTLAANPALALLHYKVTPTNNGGRFPALPTNPVRQLFAYTPAPDTATCLNPDAGVCLISAANGSTSQSIAIGACSEVPAKCLQSYRIESLPNTAPPDLTNLKNFEGNLQVPPHGGSVTYYFYLQSSGDPSQNNGYWADDKDYTLLLEHKAEPDVLEAIPDPTRPATLAAGGTALNAYLSYGLGKLSDPNNPPNDVIFGPNDYDGRGDDVDTYQVTLPFASQQAWQISWSVPTSNGTDPDYDLGFTLSFCDNTPDAGTGTPPCYAMVTHPVFTSTDQLGLLYTTDKLDSWWNKNASVIPDEVVYDRQVVGGNVVTTVRPYGCFCFENRFVNASLNSYFLINIFPVNRTSWDLVQYSVTTSYAAYPYSFTNAAGGSTSCPATCQFTFF
jgi:hypothetical protein